jgi:hypothetical protein
MDETKGQAAPLATRVDQPAPAGAPSFVILQADHGGRLAGTVLRADPAALAQLERDGIEHRVATDTERRLAGFVD